MINWYSRYVVKLDVSLDDCDVVELLKLKTVSLDLSLLLNPIHSF